MRTTLVLPDALVLALKRRAAERGISLSALAAELLQRGLDEEKDRRLYPRLLHSGPDGSASPER